MASGPGKARLLEVRPLTYDTSEYTFALVDPPELRFRAGQFVSLRCELPYAAGERVPRDAAELPYAAGERVPRNAAELPYAAGERVPRDAAELPYAAGERVPRDAAGGSTDDPVPMRSYSIASPSTERDRFRLVVKLIPGGVGSAFFTALTPGVTIEFTGPMGFFVLDLAHAGDVVIGATGTGLAPVIPMLEELCARPGEHGQVRLFFGVRRLEDLFYLDRLEDLARRMPRFRFELCVTRPPPGWTGGHPTRITPHVLETVGRLVGPVYYLVGNGDMIKELRRLLQERGVDRKRQIRTEAFFPAASEP
jgi:ferredoxin-NADP reductase